ncbi:MAG TPA: siderophore-interacting protein [Caulobacteraceae bacterium]|nr:siderophore-interacting protein [Caulobacteraceae bacterium]
MTDLALQPAPFRRPAPPTWRLVVVDAFDVTPRMRRVRLVGDDMDAFAWRPGQDLKLLIPQSGAEPARRHYTIRGWDAAEQRLEIDVVLHGDGPGARWGRTARLGDEIEAQGPRGRTVLNMAADWHLFVGDETALPAIMAMAEALPAGASATAVIEVQDRGERQTPLTRARLDIEWFHRGGPPAARSPQLVERMALYRLKPGLGQAYVIGETAMVRAVRQGLIARGQPRERICAEGYWRPGRVGGHDHVFDAEDAAGAVLRRLAR